MTADARILLVEDDRELCAMLSNFFVEHGMSLVAIHDGDEAARALRAPDADLVVLDVMLPKRSGLDLLVELRRHSECPVLILTARGDDVDRVRGLELGADDYLAKPFNPRELLARVRAILRRARAPSAPETVLTVGDLQLEPARRLVRAGEQTLKLTSAELRLLEVLMRHPGRAVSRDQLCEDVLGRRLLPTDRSIDTHVSHIRGKLVQAGSGVSIASVRGTGYQLVAG
jgi:two-component system response regulator CpxR